MASSGNTTVSSGNTTVSCGNTVLVSCRFRGIVLLSNRALEVIRDNEGELGRAIPFCCYSFLCRFL